MHRNPGLACVLFAIAALSCDDKPAPDRPSAAAKATPSSTASAAACLEIEAGVRLGPVRIGGDRAHLDSLGLKVKPLSKYERSEIIEVGPVTASLCGGKVVDVWLDDLRTAKSCLSHAGKKVDRRIARDAFIAQFSKCQASPPRRGGSFMECEDGGVRIGWGMGDFIQVRVAKAGTRLDDTCEMLLDDGKPVALADASRAKMLQKVLDLDLLAGYWHRDKPGRDPLRIAANQVVQGKPRLSMFGADVVYVPSSKQAGRAAPFFEFLKLSSSSTRTRIDFRYPVEGVVGHVVFEKRGDEWTVADKSVAER